MTAWEKALLKLAKRGELRKRVPLWLARSQNEFPDALGTLIALDKWAEDNRN